MQDEFFQNTVGVVTFPFQFTMVHLWQFSHCHPTLLCPTAGSACLFTCVPSTASGHLDKTSPPPLKAVIQPDVSLCDSSLWKVHTPGATYHTPVIAAMPHVFTWSYAEVLDFLAHWGEEIQSLLNSTHQNAKLHKRLSSK